MSNVDKKEIKKFTKCPIEQDKNDDRDIYYIEDIKFADEIIAKSSKNQKSKSLRFKIDYSSEMSINKNNVRDNCAEREHYYKLENIDLKRKFSDAIKLFSKQKLRSLHLRLEPCSDKHAVGLLYSGGKDSTCRLIELLEQGETVFPIVNLFNSNNVHDKLQRDLCTYQLYRIWESVGKGELITPIFLTSISYHFCYGGSTGFTQQQHNAYSLSLLSCDILKNLKRIEMCLVMEDQGVSFVDDIKRVYKSCMKFNVIDFQLHSKIPPLTFPYLKITKAVIYERLCDFGRKSGCNLFSPSCQSPYFMMPYICKEKDGNFYIEFEYESCGRCASCEKMINSHFFSNKDTTTLFKIKLKRQIKPKPLLNSYIAECVDEECEKAVDVVDVSR